jgi:putative spermidine/putrescine transport system ATP-binding protein/spermidine/putrescine transport system ATP-binding protein
MGERAVDVELARVTKVFGDGTVAVADFSLAVRKGEFVALLGPSGCGKTTTLKMIGGFEEPTSGTITIAGRSVVGVPPERRSTGMVFQNYALFPHMNVTENVEYGLKLRGINAAERRQRVARLLALMDLTDVARRKVEQLSGGQRQRVAVARSVIVEPDVLLLDEPLGALDANLRVRMQSELKRIQRQLGITFIFVTHAQSEAMALADTIVVMNLGQIEQVGAPADIYARPATSFVARFVGNNNLVDGTLVAPNGASPGATLNGALGVFPVAAAELNRLGAPPPGAAATLVVRADQTRFADAELTEEYDSAVTGELIGEELIGSVVNYAVQLDDGRVFHVEQHESLIERAPALTEQVTIRWRSGETRLLAGAEVTS